MLIEAAFRSGILLSSPDSFIMKYKVGRHLGKGGFGQVYEATSSDSGRRYAVKYIPWSSFRNKYTLNEVLILQELQHPNIIRFEEVYNEGLDGLCIIMEYADMGDLRSYLRKDGASQSLTEDETRCGPTEYYSPCAWNCG
jgi:serine/threonine protein kinase